MLDEIAVIGARSLGQVASADLTLRGYKVNLFEEPEYFNLLDPLIQNHGIELLLTKSCFVDSTPTLCYDKIGFAKIHRITTNIEEAVKNAKIILVCVHAYRHESIAKLLGPHLKDGQIIVISIGNMGSLVFSRVLKEMGVNKDILLAETCPSLYNGRFGKEYGLNDGQCATTGPVLVDPKDSHAKVILLSAFPAKSTDKAIESLKHLFKFEKGSNVLEVALSSNNIMYHAPACILNACAIDKSKGQFRLHRNARDENDVLTPSLMNIYNAIRDERAKIFKAMDWTLHDSFTHASYFEKNPAKLPSPVMLQIGPTSMNKHRFIVEDVPVGLRFLSDLGDLIGVPTPSMKTIIQLASLINQTDYFKTGLTVKTAGIAGMSISQLKKYLNEEVPRARIHQE